MPSDIRQSVYRTLIKSLKPGGIILAELFSQKQLELDSGGPKNTDYLVTPEIMANDFAGLKISMNQDVDIELNEGPFHQGKAHVVRFLAKN